MQSTKEETLELIKNYLPKYLTPELKESLYKAVKDNFPQTIDSKLIYCNLNDTTTYYQGDGIIDIPFSYFNQGKFETVYFDGIVLSNTCDISNENKRLEDSFYQFATIHTLEEYITELKKREINDERIKSFSHELRNNRISNLFFLPEVISREAQVLSPESFVRFDSTISLPSEIFNSESSEYDKDYAQNDGDRLFTLSNYGFYMLLIKISIHYCRFREGVFRNE